MYFPVSNAVKIRFTTHDILHVNRQAEILQYVHFVCNCSLHSIRNESRYVWTPTVILLSTSNGNLTSKFLA